MTRPYVTPEHKAVVDMVTPGFDAKTTTLIYTLMESNDYQIVAALNEVARILDESDSVMLKHTVLANAFRQAAKAVSDYGRNDSNQIGLSE